MLCRDCQTELTEDCACMNCGLVNDVYLDTSAEWRSFSGMDGVRCGSSANIWVPETQLNTYIKGGGHLNTIQKWTHLSIKEKNVIDTNAEFEHVAQAYDVNDMVLNLAKEYYSLVYDSLESQLYGTKRCSVKRPLKTACLYFASKNCGCPRKIKEFCSYMKVEPKAASKACNVFLDLIGDKIGPVQVSRAIDYVPRFCTQLGLNEHSKRLIEKLVMYIEEKEILTDNTPITVVSTCIYYLIKQDALEVTPEQVRLVGGSSLAIMEKLVCKLEGLELAL